jgi:uncharacterized peroxidase-related enzyme
VVEQVSRDYRESELEPRLRALCDFAVQVTRAPASVAEADVERLREHRWSDAAIHDAIQTIAYFNYINRVADAVGVENEPEWES